MTWPKYFLTKEFLLKPKKKFYQVRKKGKKIWWIFERDQMKGNFGQLFESMDWRFLIKVWPVIKNTFRLRSRANIAIKPFFIAFETPKKRKLENFFNVGKIFYYRGKENHQRPCSMRFKKGHAGTSLNSMSSFSGLSISTLGVWALGTPALAILTGNKKPPLDSPPTFSWTQ